MATGGDRKAFARLDSNQRELLRLIARGWTNGEIARALGAPLDLVKVEVNSVLAALEVDTREEAAEAWQQFGVRRHVPVPSFLRTVGFAATGMVALGVAVVWGAFINTGGAQSQVRDSGAEPSPAAVRRTAAPVAVPLFRCPTRLPLPPQPTTSTVDWVDAVHFDGVTYMPLAGGAFSSSAVGSPYAEVAFRLEGVISDSSYRLQDCDATFLDAGTVFRTVGGYDPRFRLALADGTVYEAVSREGATSAAEFLDIEGRVASLEIRDVELGLTLATISDSATLTMVVSELLAADFDSSASEGDNRVVLAFRLVDGSQWVRGYDLDSREMWPGMALSSRFNDAILDALNH